MPADDVDPEELPDVLFVEMRGVIKERLCQQRRRRVTPPRAGERICRIAASSIETATGGLAVPPKPNYNFERLERQRQKAAKKAARAEAKKNRADERKAQPAKPGPTGPSPE